MLRFNTIGSKEFGRKIFDVEGYDQVRSCSDRGGKDVPVIGIGE